MLKHAKWFSGSPILTDWRFIFRHFCFRWLSIAAGSLFASPYCACKTHHGGTDFVTMHARPCNFFLLNPVIVMHAAFMRVSGTWSLYRYYPYPVSWPQKQIQNFHLITVYSLSPTAGRVIIFTLMWGGIREAAAFARASPCLRISLRDTCRSCFEVAAVTARKTYADW